MAIEKQINIVVKETGLDEVQKQVNKLDSSLENLGDTNKGVTKSMGESSNAVLENGGAMGLLNDATGGLAMTVKDAVEASWLFTKSQKAASIVTAIQTTVVGTSTGAMKAFRIALAATGIGLIVIGLGLLIANFDKVKKAVLAFIPGLSIVGDIFTSLVQKVTDFVGVTSDASRELDRLGKQAENTLAKNKFALDAYGDTYDQYTKRKIEANTKYAQHVKDINEDETLSEKQKLERLKILRETANREISKAEQDRISERNKKAKEAQDKIDEANKAAAEKAKQEREKEAEEIAKEKEDYLKKANEIRDTQDELDFEKRQKDKELANQDFLDGLQKQADKAQAESEVANNSAEEQKRINEQKIADEELVRDAKFKIANSVFDLVNMFAKKGSKLAKGVAAAQATMNTYQGITAALAAPSTVPEPFGTALKIANSVMIGATGFMNVKKILSTNEQGGGGSTGGGGGGSMPSAPSFNLVQGTNSNQIAQSINTQQPIEAYVVSKNVSTGQELDRNIIKSASL